MNYAGTDALRAILPRAIVCYGQKTTIGVPCWWFLIGSAQRAAKRLRNGLTLTGLNGHLERNLHRRHHEPERTVNPAVAENDRAPAAFDRIGLAAFVLYAALSVFFFSRGLLLHLANARIGVSSDQSQFMWCLVWWPYAIVHRINPFLTRALWAPLPFNIAWTTCIPLPALLGMPLTYAVGPAVSFNVLSLLALSISAWCAFLLCRYITKAPLWSIPCGYIFGFSPYMLDQLRFGHLNLTPLFAPPLAVYFVLLALDDKMTKVRLASLLGLVLTAQFLCSTETFATLTMFGVMVLFLGWSFAPHETRIRLSRLIPAICGGYALALVLLSPYFYYLAAGTSPGRIWSPAIFSVDLFNFLIPTSTNQLGLMPPFPRLSSKFQGTFCEPDGYLGLPLLLVAAVYARRHWREPLGKTLIDSLGIIWLLSLGPQLKVAGHHFGGLPEQLLAAFPLISSALPSRFPLYAFLDLAVITSSWLATTKLSTVTKTLITLAIVFSLLPNLSSRYWVGPLQVPAFFSDQIYPHYLSRDEIVVALPYSGRGDSMLWQAKTGMYFRMAGGYMGQPPEEFARWPIANAFVDATYVPDTRAQLMAFLANHQVSTVIVSDDDPDGSTWRSLLAASGCLPKRVAGVTLYRVRQSEAARYSGVTSLEAAVQANRATFGALIAAAGKYLANRTDPANLSSGEVTKLGFLPSTWLIGPPRPPEWLPVASKTAGYTKTHFRHGVWLGASPNGEVIVALEGYYDSLKPLVENYRGDAVHVYFPSPLVNPSNAKNGDWGALFMVFDRAGLARAAAVATANAETPRESTGAPSTAPVPAIAASSRPGEPRKRETAQ
jgi:hypothetical protein